MITNFFKYIRLVLLVGLMMGMTLLAVEVYFVVTNSNRPDFWPDDGDAPHQDMSSGLFSAYIHEDNPDFRIGDDVFHAVNAVVAGPIGDQNRAVVKQLDEAWPIALGRAVDTLFTRRRNHYKG